MEEEYFKVVSTNIGKLQSELNKYREQGYNIYKIHFYESEGEKYNLNREVVIVFCLSDFGNLFLGANKLKELNGGIPTIGNGV